MAGIVIVDYGMGNLKSVRHAFAQKGMDVTVSGAPERVKEACGLVLPGVGAFGRAMENLNRGGLTSILKDKVVEGTPFLGICLGLQLLFHGSEESPGVSGLGLLPGTVVRFREGGKIPLIGWNELKVIRQTPLLKGLRREEYFYFVHSYFARPADGEDVLALSFYGREFPAVVGRGNCFGLQFHPEKSSFAGLKLVENFGKMVKDYANHTRH